MAYCARARIWHRQHLPDRGEGWPDAEAPGRWLALHVECGMERAGRGGCCRCARRNAGVRRRRSKTLIRGCRRRVAEVLAGALSLAGSICWCRRGKQAQQAQRKRGEATSVDVATGGRASRGDAQAWARGLVGTLSSRRPRVGRTVADQNALLGARWYGARAGGARGGGPQRATRRARRRACSRCGGCLAATPAELEGFCVVGWCLLMSTLRAASRATASQRVETPPCCGST